MTRKGYQVSFCGDENVLEQISGEDNSMNTVKKKKKRKKNLLSCILYKHKFYDT